MQVEEIKPKPTNSNIQAQYQPMYQPQYQGPPQYAQGVPMGYQPQPMPGYYQPQPGQQQVVFYGQQPYMSQPMQQVVVMQVIQPASEKVLLEERIRHAAKWFNGCNTVWAIFVLINLISRSASLFGEDEGSAEAAGVIIIIEYLMLFKKKRNIIWLGAIAIGIYGMMKFFERYLLYYQWGLGVVMVFEVIASIIIFASVRASGGSKALMVIFFILTILCLSSFIHHARQLRVAIIMWLSINDGQPPSQGAPPQQNDQ